MSSKGRRCPPSFLDLAISPEVLCNQIGRNGPCMFAVSRPPGAPFFWRAISWFSRIRCPVRCRPNSWPSSTRLRCMHGQSWVPFDSAKAVWTCARWSMSCRRRRKEGRSCQANMQRRLIPGVRHIRLIRKLLLVVGLEPTAPQWLVPPR